MIESEHCFKEVVMTRYVTFLFLITLAGVLFSPLAWANPAEANSQGSTATGVHPMVLTPEKTLTTILNAYIHRDPATVLAYVHPVIQKNPDRMARWADLVQHLTTDRLHVVSIVEVRVVGVTARGKDRVASLVAKVQTTAGFGGGKDLGDNVREYQWSLVQLGGKGPWYHDGGGF